MFDISIVNNSSIIIIYVKETLIGDMEMWTNYSYLSILDNYNLHNIRTTIINLNLNEMDRMLLTQDRKIIQRLMFN